MSKTLSFAVMHTGVAFSVVWLMTGDVLIGGAVALVEPMVNTVGYHIHEALWARRRAMKSGVAETLMTA